MKKKANFIVEIGLGILLTGFVAYAYFTRTTFVETASLKFYDSLTQFQSEVKPNNAFRIVEIDEASVGALGRWPWPRSLSADLVDEVFDYGAAVIGLNVLFAEPDQNEGLAELDRLYEQFAVLMDKNRRELKRSRANLNEFENFLLDLDDTRRDLDGDAILGRAVDEAGNVVLPMYFIPGDPQGENLPPLPDFVQDQAIKGTVLPEEAGLWTTGIAATPPLALFGSAARAVGHVNLLPDQDGVVRRIPPGFLYDGKLIPSFGLQLIRAYKQLPTETFTKNPGRSYSLQAFQIPIDEEGQTYIRFAGKAGTFPRYSAIDVLTRAIPEDALKDKIVLVGTTAPGLGQNFVVPSGESLNELEIWTNHLSNVLGQNFTLRPEWAPMAEWGFILLGALVVIVLLPFVRGRISIPLSAIIFAGMGGASFYFFTQQGFWVTPAYGGALMIMGFLAVVARRLIFTEKGKEMVEAEGMETNKMLGLSFQGQGMLDLAFEKFRKCPMDGQLKDLLYNLGLDMERKRMFSKAAAVYEHIATDDPKYKDIQHKIDLLKKAGQGAVFGGVGKKGSDATVVVEGLGQSTTLGRYEVVRELGRGAMGIVYLGKDPKINRQVAIKTLRFDDEVSEDQAKSIKERFFREAESAGNLTHPNIIRIFDAGEDQDVAYIAMELIEGQDLKSFCEKENLFTIDKVLSYMAQVADGLAYAHQQGVVHRDIKPQNIMLLKDGTLRITDFGIARIQATSKTATGAVLGTPAYMSPEQVNGKKVDGRADIFSLGVTTFELLTGEKPFAADSIAALLYRIANVDHPDPREYNPNISEKIVEVLKKALAKEAGERFQDAAEFAAALRSCVGSVPSEAPAGNLESSDEPSKVMPPAPEPQKIEEKTSPVENKQEAAEAEAGSGIEREEKTNVEEISPLEGLEQNQVTPEQPAPELASESTQQDLSPDEAETAINSQINEDLIPPTREEETPEKAEEQEPSPQADPFQIQPEEAPLGAEPEKSGAKSDSFDELSDILSGASSKEEAPPQPGSAAEETATALNLDSEEDLTDFFFGENGNKPAAPEPENETPSAPSQEDPEKTVAIEGDQDKTIALEKGFELENADEIPLVDNIETTFQPPAPDSNQDENKTGT